MKRGNAWIAGILVAVLCSGVALAESETACTQATVKPLVECARITVTVSNEDADTWWGNRGAAFGAYLEFDPAQIKERPRKVIEFGPIYFDLDKSLLREEGIATAEILYTYLEKHPKARVRIEGNCCDLAPDDYNLKLGQRRADAVKQYLVKRGIDPDRIDTVSHGERQRVTTDQAERPQNRRADTVLAK